MLYGGLPGITRILFIIAWEPDLISSTLLLLSKILAHTFMYGPNELRSVRKLRAQIFCLWHERSIDKSFIVWPQYPRRKVFGKLSDNPYKWNISYEENLTNTTKNVLPNFRKIVHKFVKTVENLVSRKNNCQTWQRFYGNCSWSPIRVSIHHKSTNQKASL